MNRLPRGIYYEEQRGRYRVRLYRDGQPVYLSYHRDLTEAEQALAMARKAVADLPPLDQPLILDTPAAQIDALLTRF